MNRDRPRHGRCALSTCVAFGIGLAWVQVTWSALFWLFGATERSIGARVLSSLFYNPVMLAWEAADLPPGLPGRTALYLYYASLACIVWNAPASRRASRLATTVYVLHATAVLFATLIYGCGIPIPRLAIYYGWADLREFWRLAQRAPSRVALYGLCLLVGHATLGWRLWRGWRAFPAYASARSAAPLTISDR